MNAKEATKAAAKHANSDGIGGDTVNRDLMIEMDVDLKISLSEQLGEAPDEGQPEGEVAYGGGGVVDFLFDNFYRQ